MRRQYYPSLITQKWWYWDIKPYSSKTQKSPTLALLPWLFYKYLRKNSQYNLFFKVMWSHTKSYGVLHKYLVQISCPRKADTNKFNTLTLLGISGFSYYLRTCIRGVFTMTLNWKSTAKKSYTFRFKIPICTPLIHSTFTQNFFF